MWCIMCVCVYVWIYECMFIEDMLDKLLFWNHVGDITLSDICEYQLYSLLHCQMNGNGLKTTLMSFCHVGVGIAV